jgi:3-oxoacyl-[acyl-carrier protein] reductase
MNLNLKGKNALVCGGSSGIGKASAILLSAQGANVTLLARNVEALTSALNELHRAPGQDHSFIIADTTDHAELHQKITGLVAQQKVHILVNNTGGPPAGAILDAELDGFRNAFEQHLLAYH